MTICVGALAARGKSIVCVADKAVSYGDYIQWDADSTKIIELSKNALACIAGNGGHIDRVIKRIGQPDWLGKDLTQTMKHCEEAYQQARQELVEIEYLKPTFLDRDQYVAAVTSIDLNPQIQELARQIGLFRMDCSILFCGFDSADRPYLFHLDEPGKAEDMSWNGFHAIGSGWDKAIGRMLFSEWKREHPIERVIYDTFDAKAAAEMAVGVGYEWDSMILMPGKSVEVPKKTKDLLERIWSAANRSPFHEWEKDDLDPPPRNWKKQLRNFISSILPDSG